MKKIDENTYVYRFNELSDQVQDKVKDNVFTSYPEELLEEELTNVGESLLQDELPLAIFEGIDYDLNWSSQNYGAVLSFKYTDLDEFLHDFAIVKKYIDKKIDISDIELDQVYFEFTCVCHRRYARQELNYTINGYDDKTDELASILDEYLYQNLDDRVGDVGSYIKNLQDEFTTQVEQVVDSIVNNEYQFEEEWYFADGKFAGFDEDFEEK